MIGLRELAIALGGEVSGQQVLAPGPGHTPRDRSLAVRPTPQGFVCWSFNGDDFRDCRDHVADRLGISQRDRIRVERVRPAPAERDKDFEPPEVRTARAVAIWNEARPIAGTIVETYLASRALTPPDTAALRFHPRCPWRDKDADRTIRVPAMIAAMRSIETDELVAIHRTRLTPEGAKVDRRMLGLAAGAVVKLDGEEALRGELVAGEGIETVLAARQLGLTPAWACCSTSILATFPLLSGIGLLRLLRENDRLVNGTRASEVATNAAGARWHAAGRTVKLITPPVGCKDLNDFVMRSGRRG